MSKFTDPYVEGLARGWQIVDASALTGDRQLEADVVIVGTGAGGGVTAETLCKAGLKVVLLEEGPLKTTRDFKMRESEAYPSLYQESAARQTKDKGISIIDIIAKAPPEERADLIAKFGSGLSLEEGKALIRIIAKLFGVLQGAILAADFCQWSPFHPKNPLSLFSPNKPWNSQPVNRRVPKIKLSRSTRNNSSLNN